MSKTTPAPQAPAGPALLRPAHTGVWQVRLDTWSALQDTAQTLSRAATPRLGFARRATELVARIQRLEGSWAFPGAAVMDRVAALAQSNDWTGLDNVVSSVHRALLDDSYRKGPVTFGGEQGAAAAGYGGLPYFEVLVVGELTLAEEQTLREELHGLRRPEDGSVYELVIVPSAQDALIAAQCNVALQAVVLRTGFGALSTRMLDPDTDEVDERVRALEDQPGDTRALLLAGMLADVRPELDLYLVADASVEAMAADAGNRIRRIFYRREGVLGLHMSILQGVARRYRTPFFDALRDYSQQPTGVFHALPISGAASLVGSHWIPEMAEFYGLNMFLAETSATSGGLDSLLDPVGPLKEAQELAAEAFGAQQTYFVTNGTSTANKIVSQALLTPGDIALVDRNCHKSHHYALALVGAHVAYLDAYPLNDFGMYGGVPLTEIKATLLDLRKAGKLDRVRLIMLTNCTFDGVLYDVERVMQECLAIKPDLVFLWDEAWFAFARFHPAYRDRTAMYAAQRLRERFASSDYREQYSRQQAALGEDPSDADLLATVLLPDPDRARVRVYATQSTHKTLTSLRQGSMIHVRDQDFGHKVSDTFREAYLTHTSTSPNYQILASLDLGRRQASLEGFDLVQGQLEYALTLRRTVETHPLLSGRFRFLDEEDLVPTGGEFTLDPSRATLFTGALGLSGDEFKALLMQRYGVQVNKTSRNTVLFMTTIGTSRSAVAYLVEVLADVVRQHDERLSELSPRQRVAHDDRVAFLSGRQVPLPDFSAFDDRFKPGGDKDTREGDLRSAYFLAYREETWEHVPAALARSRVAAGEQLVSASFVTPYPPGFPVLVPGQVIREDVLEFMERLETPEIHGYRPADGYRVFRPEFVGASASPDTNSVLAMVS